MGALPDRRARQLKNIRVNSGWILLSWGIPQVLTKQDQCAREKFLESIEIDSDALNDKVPFDRDLDWGGYVEKVLQQFACNVKSLET